MTEQKNEERRQKQMKAFNFLLESTTKDLEINLPMLDSKILMLSAGALGLSLTFITNLVDLNSAEYILLLILSWILFCGSILAVLFGLRWSTSKKTTHEHIDIAKQASGIGDYAEKGPNLEAAQKRMDVMIKRVDDHNKLSFWMFVLALIALMAFISISILAQ